MLQEGQCIATKILEEGKPAEKVMDYSIGSYFGERALLKNEPRAANVIAETDCVLVSMNRHAVKRLLGPLEQLLRRNMEMYEKFTIKK
jgi:cAMP-dependent protein kinase regulator